MLVGGEAVNGAPDPLGGTGQGSVTSRYIHAVDTSLIMAADTVAGYIQALLEGAQFQRRGYALDRASREMALSRHLGNPLPLGVSHLAEASAADQTPGPHGRTP